MRSSCAWVGGICVGPRVDARKCAVKFRLPVRNGSNRIILSPISTRKAEWPSQAILRGPWRMVALYDDKRTDDARGTRRRLPKKGRLMGLDLGTKTIGLALSDVERRLASPLDTIRRVKFSADADICLSD